MTVIPSHPSSLVSYHIAVAFVPYFAALCVIIVLSKHSFASFVGFLFLQWRLAHCELVRNCDCLMRFNSHKGIGSVGIFVRSKALRNSFGKSVKWKFLFLLLLWIICWCLGFGGNVKWIKQLIGGNMCLLNGSVFWLIWNLLSNI